MAAFFSSLLATLIPKLLELLWSKADKVLKEQLAKNQLKNYIDQIQADYNKVRAEYENLKLLNKLNEQEIEKLRAAKIKLEEKLLNSGK